MLLQNDGEGLRPISYISRSLSDAEKKQHCNELECLALVWALGKFRPYLYGKKFKVEMDSSAVKWLLNKNQMGKFGRWILALQEYDFEIRHIRGVTNCVADGLSRSPLVDSTDGFSSTEVIYTFVSKFNLQTGLEQNELRFQQKVNPRLGPIFSLQCKTKLSFPSIFVLKMVSYIVKLRMISLCVSPTPYVILFFISVTMFQQRVIWEWKRHWRESDSGTGGSESQLMFVNMFFHVFIVSFISTKPVSHLACCNRYHLHQTALSQS